MLWCLSGINNLSLTVSNYEQITNLQLIHELRQLVPEHMSENWSFKPLTTESNMSRNSINWGSGKVSRQIIRTFVDLGLEGDTLSNYKTRQCFPLPYGTEPTKANKAKTSNLPEEGTSGFFSPNLKQFY